MNKNYTHTGKQVPAITMLFILAAFVLFIVGSRAGNPTGAQPSMANVQAAEDKKIISQGVVAEKEKEQLTESLHSNGMRFTENKGQLADMNGKLRPDVLYKGDGGGADIYLRKTGISYVYTNIGEVQHEVHEKVEALIKAGILTEADEHTKQDELMREEKIKIHRVDMDFANSSPTVVQVNEDELDGYTNYYHALCPNGITNVKQYNKVTYKNIYNGIDVTYYGDKQKGVKYDLVVKPHADPNQIKLHWKGAESICLNPKGYLVVKTGVNEFTESIPKVYQIINGKIVDVIATYRLTCIKSEIISCKVNKNDSGLISNDFIVSFKLSNYQTDFPLIIDPWVTYFGGAGDDWGYAIETDPTGNVAFTGFTSSINFPVSPGAFQTIFSGFSNAFVVKMNSNGNRLWATYFGNGTESGSGISTDAAGNILVSGSTAANFPVGSSAGNIVYQNTFGGSTDAFLLKLDPSGARLWATYYGGTKADSGSDVVCDGNTIYLYGTTNSINGISTPGSFQPALNGSDVDLFVSKFNSNGSRVWASYIGGSISSTQNNSFTGEQCGGIVCDKFGDIYIAGTTSSINFPVSAGAHQMTLTGGVGTDAFLFKFDPFGNRQWATYYGGNSPGAPFEGAHAVTCDGNGDVIIGGTASSPTNISTPGASQFIRASWCDAFIAKFNSVGVRQWGTYLGGGNNEYVNGLDCDVNNNIIAGGDTYSTNFPVTSCAYQKLFAGTEDQFVTVFKSDGSRVCSGLIGIGNPTSPNNETDVAGGCIAVYGCFVYLVAFTECTYPVTNGAFQTVCGGGWDCAVAQLYFNTCGGITSNLSINENTTSICSGEAVNYISNYISCDLTGIKYFWNFPGGTPSASTNQNPAIIYTTPGVYDVKLVVEQSCGRDSVIKLQHITVKNCNCNLSGGFTKGAANCTNCGCKEWIMVTATGGTSPYTYTWPDGYSNRYKNHLCPGGYTINIKDKNGCSINVSLTAP